MKVIDTKTFIEKSKLIHGDKYDYSKVEYINSKTKVCIICPIHGEFLQIPNSHLRGIRCSKCGNRYNKTSEDFIKEAKEVHGDKYDYSKVEYVNNYTKVCIICPIHGEFWVKPNNHLQGQNCFRCIKVSCTEDFIKKAKEVHGDKYDYSKVEYIDTKRKVCIICPIHGEFYQSPNDHLNGRGCTNCVKKCVSTESFINLSKKIHGNKYDYSKVEYIDIKSKVCIICKKHGEFYQSPTNHLNGCGCPYCNESHLEREVDLFLKNVEIEYERQKRFDWLGKQSLDFYFPQYNIAIECQGSQHYINDKYFKDINDNKQRDERKRLLCKENGIELVYYQDKKFNCFIDDITNKVLNTIDDLNEYIKNIVFI